jgi:hypothetical protein
MIVQGWNNWDAIGPDGTALMRSGGGTITSPPPNICINDVADVENNSG